MEDGNVYDNDRGDYRRGDRRDRGGRRRERKPREKLRRDRNESQDSQYGGEESDMNGSSQFKTPIILAKKGITPDVSKKDTPTILAIQRRSGNESTPSQSLNISSSTKHNISENQYQKHHNSSSRYEKSVEITSPATPMQPQQPISHLDHHIPTGLAALDISADAYPVESTNLIDGNFMWNDKGFEFLLDQSDFLVIGCVGMQGAGKSTLLSFIAGEDIQNIEKMRYVFRPQKKVDMEKCMHRTVGIDMYVTKERLILLDTQPLLSPAMLDQYLRYDRKVPSEFTTAEICLEVQALQVLTFLYTVCNIVIVAQDHFNDFNLMNLLKTAEILKPSTISSHNTDTNSSSKPDDFNEFFPYLVFAYTCCENDAYDIEIVHGMCDVICKVFNNSRLRVTGSASMIRTPVLPYRHSDKFCSHINTNLFFIPSIYKTTPEGDIDDSNNPLSKYTSHASLQTLIRILRQQLASAPREPLTHHILSERNWFHYAARTWEAVKKSNLIGEYHRLLST